MIQYLDQALREFLTQELEKTIRDQVDISFDQPSRQWSEERGQPLTLSLFLYDLRENPKLRQTQPMWEVEQRTAVAVTRRRGPVRADLHYLITAWANDPRDEHLLLGQTWKTLLRHPHLPADLLPEKLDKQPVPIPIRVAQVDELRNPTDVWNVLNNEMRPALTCTLTVALDPDDSRPVSLVREYELRVGQSSDPRKEKLDEDVAPDVFWTIGGTLKTQTPLDQIEMRLVERDRKVEVMSGGRFVVGPLHGGNYTLEVKVEGHKPRRFTIKVPSADVELEL